MLDNMVLTLKMLVWFTLDYQVITVVGNVRLGCEMRINDQLYSINYYFLKYCL